MRDYTSFNTFLKDNNIKVVGIGSKQAKRFSFNISDGWLDLVHNLMSDLLQLGWNGEFNQVKEKFGTLRFYIPTGTSDIYDTISEYEKASETICEICGKPSTLHTTPSGWIYNRCEECFNTNL